MVRNSECFSLLQNGLEQNSEHFIFLGRVRNKVTKFWLFSLLWNGLERNSKHFIFCRMVRNNITKFLVFYVLWTEWTSQFFYLPRNASERNSERSPFPETDEIPTEWIKIFIYISCSSETKIFSENGNPSFKFHLQKDFVNWLTRTVLPVKIFVIEILSAAVDWQGE